MSSASSRPSVLAPIAAGLVSLAAFWAIGVVYLDGYALELGSLTMPAPRHAWCLLVWSFFGSLAVAGFAIGIARAVAHRYGVERFVVEWAGIPDRTWLLAGSALGVLFPLAVRFLVLDGAPLTDDESAYRFAARLLASGRLTILAPPMKIFFDHTLVINDARMYAAYFLGWPALMVPGIWLGAPWIMNPIYCGLTVPPLFLVLRQMAGSGWAKVGVVLYLSSPMLMIAAATELTHTTCLAALAWCLWLLMRSRASDSPAWSHFGVALFFGLAFFIRPLSAIGIGLPLLAAWGWHLRRLPRRTAWRALAAFAASAVLLASLFLLVNKTQNGSFFTTGYEAYARYAVENDFRFATFSPTDPKTIFSMHFAGLGTALAKTGIALMRLNFDLFGWSCSLLFAFFAVGVGTRLPWALLVCFVAFHFFQIDSGVDSFGPTHYVEAALPLLLLSVLGLESLTRRVARTDEERGHGSWLAALPASLLVALIATAWSGYTLVRLRALHRISESVNAPRRAVEAAGLRNAVVFAPWPFAHQCASYPTQHFVYQRPISHPDLDGDILWVNHIGVTADQELVERFPGREGYILLWLPSCQVGLLPVAGLPPDAVPDGPQRPGD